MRVLITGSSGFIGQNLVQHLSERQDISVTTFSHDQSPDELAEAVQHADAIVHLAGVNRPQNAEEFASGNTGFTRALCNAVKNRPASGKPLSAIIYASSTQAVQDNDYGRSKRDAEDELKRAGRETGVPVFVYRLANVFGKWCRPNYNSVVATFCHNLHHGLPLQINTPDAKLKLVYVDDVVEEFLNVLLGARPSLDEQSHAVIAREYDTTVGELAAVISAFAHGRENLQIEEVGSGFKRALYATFMSYLPAQRFGYAIPSHTDPRGSFSEMLKTQASGQFSFFTAHPGVTRGGHYHHTKCEKFLVVKGNARFRFRHMRTGEAHEILSDSKAPFVVDTVPGWTHDITNVGDDEMIVMLWASEQFDRTRPDTYAQPL
jgi:UDP-2-acetamido-2,6-beta-L-arabino-hexul-4-ose reductase